MALDNAMQQSLEQRRSLGFTLARTHNTVNSCQDSEGCYVLGTARVLAVLLAGAHP